MKSQNTKSSDELKKEVRHELRNVRKDLDELQGRLSPGQIIDDAIFYSHGRSLGATYDHLKNNPIGTTFLSLGTILLMEDESHQTMEQNARSKVISAKDSIQSVKENVKETVKSKLPHKELAPGTAPSVGDIGKEKVDELKSTVQSKVGEVKEEFQSRQEEIKAKAAEVMEAFGEKKQQIAEKKEEKREAIKERVSGAFEGGKEKFSGALESSKDKIKNLDPLSFMALGAGLGALTGASLPISDAERDFMEDKISDKFSGLGQELQEAINETSNILKDLVIHDVKEYNFKVFK